MNRTGPGRFVAHVASVLAAARWSPKHRARAGGGFDGPWSCPDRSAEDHRVGGLENLADQPVAADAVHMAGPGELVYIVGSREAAQALPETFVPVDHAVVGIVDDVQLDEPEEQP